MFNFLALNLNSHCNFYYHSVSRHALKDSMRISATIKIMMIHSKIDALHVGCNENKLLDERHSD